MNKIFIILLVLTFSGCAHRKQRNSEIMLVDGVTWMVSILTTEKCVSGKAAEYVRKTSFIEQFNEKFLAEKESIEVGECIEKLKPKIINWGTELCGKEPHRVFACSIGERMNRGDNIFEEDVKTSYVNCYIECQDKNTSCSSK